MSAVEISQEERDLWRFEASDNCGTPSDEDERILRLLEAFEACEADLERSCEETRANFSELYRMANEVVPELKKCIVDAEARTDKAEAEVARLTKIVTILSEWCAQFESGHTLEEVGLALSNGMACPEPWQYVEEAARRAVDESEVKG